MGDNPLRIMHIITRMILGGAQENTLLTLRAQSETEDVCLVAGPTTGPEGTLVPDIHAAGIEYIEVPSLLRAVNLFREREAYHALGGIIRSWKPDVVHTHSSKAGILGRCAAWAEGVPCVVHTIHGLPFHPYQAFPIRLLYIGLERFAARRCHRIACVADAMRDKALAAGIGHPGLYTTVYSGMELEPFLAPTEPRDAIRARYGFSPDDVVIGKVARLFELKGHEDLLAVFARLAGDYPRARLFFVGDGLWRQRLQARAAALGVGDRVTWAGLVPRTEVADTLHAMDMLVHCSLREGLARVLPQAFLSYLPVVSYDIDGAREVVEDGVTGRLVPAQDLATLEAAIRGMLSEPVQAKAWAREGRARCRSRFDWRTMGAALLDVYREILGDGMDSRPGDHRGQA